jgi:hypothetical protein
MNQDRRVLGRVGARELTMEESEQVAGSFHVQSNVCSARMTTGNFIGDGDACGARDGDL